MKMSARSRSLSTHKKEPPLCSLPTRFGCLCEFSISTDAKLHPRDLFRTIVTITVGPKAHRFWVHKEILSAVSPFFAAALNESYGFKESASSACNLPEARVEDFKYFVQWLYTHNLDHEDLSGPNPAFYHLIHLYILADHLGVSLLKNAIIETIGRISDQANACPAPADTRLLEAKTAAASKLRTLVLDLFVWKTTDNLLLSHPDDW